MIRVNGTALETVTFQTALLELILEHLQGYVAVSLVDIDGRHFSLRSGYHLNNIFECRCFDEEVLQMANLTRMVTGELLPIPLGLAPTEGELVRVQRYSDKLKRSKIALAIMAQSRKTDEEVLAYNLGDLCTAFAFYSEAEPFSEVSRVFDDALEGCIKVYESEESGPFVEL